MPEQIFIGLVTILVLGILAQWVAWRLGLPAILLLLLFGFLAGPVLNILDPVEVFGELFFPIISVSVALILFEGSLRLKFHELREAGPLVARLTGPGILITWALAAAGAHFAAGLNWHLAVLLGAVLTVTGPTVIIPMLRQVRPVGRLASAVKWEGIVNDPIGAILAVLTFEVILPGNAGVSSILAAGVLKALGTGVVAGLGGAGVMIIVLKRYLLPDYLVNPFSTMLVVVVFTASNAMQSESGLLAVTVMGMALANQKWVSIRPISEFKENLQVILIASLFIMLAARLPVEGLQPGNWGEWLFIILLVVAVRPLAVFGATIGAEIDTRGRLFLSWIAPRGIVAAAVVSVFALRLEESGIAGVDRLVPIMFKVIFVTVAVYGLTVPLVARRLGVAKPNPQGVIFGGAQAWVRKVACALRENGFPVLLVDSNWSNYSTAKEEGLSVYYGSLLSEEFFTRVPLDEMGTFIAVTSNDEVNSLAAIHFAETLGRAQVYQLPPGGKAGKEWRHAEMPTHLRGRHAFGEEATHEYIERLFARGGEVVCTTISDVADMERHSGDALALFVMTAQGELRPVTADGIKSVKRGERLLSVVAPAKT